MKYLLTAIAGFVIGLGLIGLNKPQSALFKPIANQLDDRPEGERRLNWDDTVAEAVKASEDATKEMDEARMRTVADINRDLSKLSAAYQQLIDVSVSAGEKKKKEIDKALEYNRKMHDEAIDRLNATRRELNLPPVPYVGEQ